MSTVTLKKLISRGDTLAICRGRLEIKPASGRPVPEDWLRKNREPLVQEIAQGLQEDLFVFISHRTGRYGKGRYPGVCLTFQNLRNGAILYLLFNADLNRTRDTKSGRRGSPLPAGQFRVTKKHGLSQFWIGMGMNPPPRWCQLCRYMGNLSQLVFQGDEQSNGRIRKETLRPATLPASRIEQAIQQLSTPELYPNDAQHTPIPYPVSVSSQPRETRSGQAFRRKSGTCESSHELSNQGITSEDFPSTSPLTDTPQETVSNDEWLNDYLNAEAGNEPNPPLH